MIPNTPACDLSEGKVLIGKDCESQHVVQRLNSVDKLLCDVSQRIETAGYELSRFCPDPSIPPPPVESESSSDCPLACDPPAPDSAYLLTVNDLDQDVYDALALLEEEACALLELNLEFVNCNPEESSSEDSSEDSSEEPAPSCPLVLHLVSYCPDFPYVTELLPSGYAAVNVGACTYAGDPTTTVVPTAEESSDSSDSGSMIEDGRVHLFYDEMGTRWVIYKSGIPWAMKTGTPYNPQGTYTFFTGPCSTQAIFVM